LNYLGVIPARGGSKGVPGKNISVVAGKPLIAWTIEAAKASRGLTRCIVSTDDELIANVAMEYGSEVPFLRPKELAMDTSPQQPALLHAIQWLREHDQFETDYVVILQPTSPLRTACDIDAAIELRDHHDAKSVVSVFMPHGHPLWSKKVTTDGLLEDYFPAYEGSLRRQDLPAAYMPNGAVYVVDVELLQHSDSVYSDRSYGYIMPLERSLDIDVSWELELARLILEKERTS